MPRDFYEVLGVSKTASDAEIKSAYRKKALEFHPDRNKSADAEKNFKEVNEAYQVISDPQKRQTYDQYGHSAFQQGGAGGGNPFAGGNPFGGQGPFSYTYTTSSGGANNPFAGFDFGGGSGDPFDVFEAFFGGGNPFGSGGQKRKPRYALTITFKEAAKGVEKTVSINGKQQTIKIPAGAGDGTRIRFNEFDVTIEVQPDPVFKRDGFDLFVDKTVALTTAILGGEIEVPTLDEPLKIKVRAGTQPNTMIRLREQGIQQLRGRGKGDLYVRLIITVPTKLTKKQKELIEAFESAR